METCFGPAMPRSASELTEHLGYWLRFVSNHVSGEFARRLQVRGVKVVEWVLLRNLYDNPGLPPSELADRLGVTRGAVTKLADKLIVRSLIERTSSPGDGRAQSLSLTAKGRALVPVLAAMADENDAAYFDHLPVADRRALLRILKSIVERRNLAGPPID